LQLLSIRKQPKKPSILKKTRPYMENDAEAIEKAKDMLLFQILGTNKGLKQPVVSKRVQMSHDVQYSRQNIQHRPESARTSQYTDDGSESLADYLQRVSNASDASGNRSVKSRSGSVFDNLNRNDTLLAVKKVSALLLNSMQVPHSKAFLKVFKHDRNRSCQPGSCSALDSVEQRQLGLLVC